MEHTARQITLKDGRTITIRVPRDGEDLPRLAAFFAKLPSDTRTSLRYDVQNPTLLAARLHEIDGQNHFRLIVEHAGEIVADATLDRDPHMWTRHVADLRVVVAEGYRHLGIGTLLSEELVEFGRDAGIERLSTEIVAEQKEFLRMLEKIGFVHEATRRNYVKDLDGRLHDVLLLSNDLGSVWRRLEEHLEEMDLAPFRYSSGQY